MLKPAGLVPKNVVSRNVPPQDDRSVRSAPGRVMLPGRDEELEGPALAALAVALAERLVEGDRVAGGLELDVDRRPVRARRRRAGRPRGRTRRPGSRPGGPTRRPWRRRRWRGTSGRCPRAPPGPPRRRDRRTRRTPCWSSTTASRNPSSVSAKQSRLVDRSWNRVGALALTAAGARATSRATRLSQVAMARGRRMTDQTLQTDAKGGMIGVRRSRAGSVRAISSRTPVRRRTSLRRVGRPRGRSGSDVPVEDGRVGGLDPERRGARRRARPNDRISAAMASGSPCIAYHSSVARAEAQPDPSRQRRHRSAGGLGGGADDRDALGEAVGAGRARVVAVAERAGPPQGCVGAPADDDRAAPRPGPAAARTRSRRSGGSGPRTARVEPDHRCRHSRMVSSRYAPRTWNRSAIPRLANSDLAPAHPDAGDQAPAGQRRRAWRAPWPARPRCAAGRR